MESVYKWNERQQNARKRDKFFNKMKIQHTHTYPKYDIRAFFRLIYLSSRMVSSFQSDIGVRVTLVDFIARHFHIQVILICDQFTQTKEDNKSIAYLLMRAIEILFSFFVSFSLDVIGTRFDCHL